MLHPHTLYNFPARFFLEPEEQILALLELEKQCDS